MATYTHVATGRFLLSMEHHEGKRQRGGHQARTEPVCDYTHLPGARQNPPESSRRRNATSLKTARGACFTNKERNDI